MNKDNYIFFDIDGTIYDYKTGVPNSTKAAIKKLRENGHHPVICTGRTRIMIFENILNLGFDGVVAGGGTYLEWEGKELFQKDMPKNEVIRVIECFRKNGFAVFAEGNKDIYFDPEHMKRGADEIYKVYQRNIPEHVLPVDYDTMKVSKISALYTESSNPQGVIDELSDDYYWTDHSGMLFETIPKEYSKGKGVEMLANQVGFDLERTYGFGDSYNDRDMLLTVKYGVVMGNGDEDLKKIVPFTCDAMLNDGVAKKLEEFGLI